MVESDVMVEIGKPLKQRGLASESEDSNAIGPLLCLAPSVAEIL